MVNHGNFLHSFLITIPSSTARELEKTAFLHQRQGSQGRSLSLAGGLTWTSQKWQKRGQKPTSPWCQQFRQVSSPGGSLHGGNSQPDKLGERISKENLKSCTRCTWQSDFCYQSNTPVPSVSQNPLVCLPVSQQFCEQLPASCLELILWKFIL